MQYHTLVSSIRYIYMRPQVDRQGLSLQVCKATDSWALILVTNVECTQARIHTWTVLIAAVALNASKNISAQTHNSDDHYSVYGIIDRRLSYLQ